MAIDPPRTRDDDTDDPLAGELAAYFEALSGADDPDAAKLAAVLGGGLDDAERASLVAELGPELVAQAQADDAAIADAWDADVVPLRAPRPSGRGRTWFLGAAGALAAAALALVVVAPWSTPSDGVRTKGDDDGVVAATDWELHLGVKRGGESFVFGSGGQLQTADQIGVFYSAPRPAQLVVVFADATGATVRLYPRDSETSGAIPAGNRVRLDAGATLTEGAGCEWVVGALASDAFDAKAVADMVSAATVAADAGCVLPLPEAPLLQYRTVVIRR